MSTCIFRAAVGEGKIVAINVGKCMTFIEGNSSQFKAAKHVMHSINPVCADGTINRTG